MDYWTKRTLQKNLKPRLLPPAPVKTKAANTNSSPQDGGLLTKSDAIGSPDVATKISLAGWVIILVGAILSLQGGAWGPHRTIVLVVGIGAIVQAERMTGSINQVKLGASIVVALLIATTPYAAVMTRLNDASMAITDVAFNEESNEIDSKYEGPCHRWMSPLRRTVPRCGAESDDVNNDIKNFKVPIISDILHRQR